MFFIWIGTVIELIQDSCSAFKHFAGNRECGISQADLYTVPWPLNPKTSPFCGKRTALLEAMSSGGRYGFDEPYVGKGTSSPPFPSS